MVRIALLIASIAACGARPASLSRLDGSSITPARIDDTVTRLMRAAEVTGVGIAVFEHGVPVYVHAYGLRDVDHALPLTTHSVMTAASLTKAAFAYLVMTLVDDGTIDLDRPIRAYLDKPLAEYPKYSDLAGDARADKLTARMLLDHTSGFANWRWLEDDRKLAFHFEPGTRFAYSGEGIDVLQLVVETVTHTPLDRLMEARVFRPLGMTRTSMIWQPRFEGDHADGYDEYGRSLGPQRRTRPDAAGAMQTCVADYARFVAAVIHGTGLRRATRDQMLTAQIHIDSLHEFPTFEPETTTANRAIELGYGLGWGVYRSPRGAAFFKEGHDDGWRHYVVAFADGTGLLIMTNSSNGEGIFKPLLETLIADTYTPIAWERYTPYDQLPPRPPLPVHHVVAVAPAVLDTYAGHYGLSGIAITIRRDGDHLALKENDEPEQALFPETDRDFFSTSSDDRITFVVTAGQVTGFVAHTGGKDIEVPRQP